MENQKDIDHRVFAVLADKHNSLAGSFDPMENAQASALEFSHAYNDAQAMFSMPDAEIANELAAWIETERKASNARLQETFGARLSAQQLHGAMLSLGYNTVVEEVDAIRGDVTNPPVRIVYLNTLLRLMQLDTAAGTMLAAEESGVKLSADAKAAVASVSIGVCDRPLAIRQIEQMAQLMAERPEATLQSLADELERGKKIMETELNESRMRDAGAVAKTFNLDEMDEDEDIDAVAARVHRELKEMGANVTIDEIKGAIKEAETTGAAVLRMPKKKEPNDA